MIQNQIEENLRNTLAVKSEELKTTLAKKSSADKHKSTGADVKRLLSSSVFDSGGVAEVESDVSIHTKKRDVQMTLDIVKKSVSDIESNRELQSPLSAEITRIIWKHECSDAKDDEKTERVLDELIVEI